MPPSKNFAARVIVATGNVAPYTPNSVKNEKHPQRPFYPDPNPAGRRVFGFVHPADTHQQRGRVHPRAARGEPEIQLGSARKLED